VIVLGITDKGVFDGRWGVMVGGIFVFSRGVCMDEGMVLVALLSFS
jgi:hypothetical protein